MLRVGKRQEGGAYVTSMHVKDANHWPGKCRSRRYKVKKGRLNHFTIVKTVIWGSVSISASNIITQNSTT